MNNELDRYVSPKELARALGLSRETLYGLMRRGILPEGAKLGRSRRWRVSDIQAALAQCELGVNA